MKKTNIILANAPINNGNKGCVALSVTAMFLIDEIMESLGKEYNLYLPDSQYRDNKEHCFTVGGRKIKFFDCDYPVSKSKAALITGFIKRALGKNNRNKEIFKKADYILDIGQGDSFADIYGKKRFALIDLVHCLARKFNKPYCMLPQTIGPFTDSVIKSKADKSIAKSTVCMARDKQSFRYVLENVPEQKQINEYIDVAFILPFEKIVQNEKYIHIGLNISGLLWNGGYTRDNQFGLKLDYQRLIRQIIEYFLSLPRVRLHLIAHVTLGCHNVENDYEIGYNLWREYKNPNIVLAPFGLGPVEIKDYIAGMDFFIGARMHATIGAFSSGVPVVPMAYSRKFNGLFVDTLQYPHLVDMKCMDEKTALLEIKKSFENRTILKSLIEDRMQGIVQNRKEMLVNDLKKFVCK